MSPLSRRALFLLAAAEIGLALGLAPGMTPGRAIAVAVCLGVTSAATLAFMELSAMRFKRLTTVVAAVAFAFGPLAGGVAARSSDPTQARPSDLDLQVSCSVSADRQTITAQVSFVWRRADLTFPGANTGPGYDVVGVFPQDLTSAEPWLNFSLENPALVDPESFPWNQQRPSDLRVDGRPDGSFGRSAALYDGRDLVPSMLNGGMYLLDVPNSSLQAGPTYSAQWSFRYSPNGYSLPADQLLLVAYYGHARRFVVQALAECGPSPKSHPQRSATYVEY
jgi:hypothetical protein